MYSYFNIKTQTNFKTKNNLPHFLDRLDNLSWEAKSLYTMLIGYIGVNKSHEQYKTGKITKQYGIYKVVDGDNVYVEAARSTIAKIMGKAIGTIRKYINELRIHGLLVDVRVGQGAMNKLFLKYPVDAEYTYIHEEPKNKEMCESLEIEKGQEKSGQGAATSSPHKPLANDVYIKVKSIVSQLTDDCLSNFDCKNLLKQCKGDTEDEKLLDLQRAVEDCYGKTPTKSYLRMIFSTLKHRNYDKQLKEKNTKPPTKQVKKVKSGFQTDMYSHNWDLDELEKLASECWRE